MTKKPTYYCRQCADHLKIIDTSISAIEPTGSPYQLEKFMKHTLPGHYKKWTTSSIFKDPAFATYSDWIVHTLASGCVEVDARNRVNHLYFAGEETGYSYDPTGKKVNYPESGVKVVLHDNDDRIHAFSINPTIDTTSLCANCGTRLLT